MIMRQRPINLETGEFNDFTEDAEFSYISKETRKKINEEIIL